MKILKQESFPHLDAPLKLKVEHKDVGEQKAHQGARETVGEHDQGEQRSGEKEKLKMLQNVDEPPLAGQQNETGRRIVILKTVELLDELLFGLKRFNGAHSV